MARLAFTLFALLAFSLSSFAGDLRVAEPEKAGLSAEGLEGLTEIAQGYVDRKQLAGVHTLVARDGLIVYNKPIGKRGQNLDEPLAEDDLYRIYSMSKPITAVAAMQLYEKGLFALDDPVSKFIPEFKDLKVWQAEGEPVEPARPMTMRHLLTHTAGFAYVFERHPVVGLYAQRQVLGSTDLEEMITKLADIPLRLHPGERWYYSVAVDVTGAVVERLSGKTFDKYLHEHLFVPLQMPDTFFSVPSDKLDRLLPNHNWRRQTEMNQQQPLAWNERLKDVTFFSGGGGLVSTGMDYLRFAEMLRRGGTLDGAKVLDPETIDLMVQNHLPDILMEAGESAGSGEDPAGQRLGARRRAFGFGLGFGIGIEELENGEMSTHGPYSWGGAAGTIFWVDPATDLVVVTLIQQMGSPWPLRRDIGAAVAGAFTE